MRPKIPSRSVAITGVGIISPLGCCLETFRKNLFDGKCGIAAITRFDPASYKCKVAAEVDPGSLRFPPYDNLIELRRMDKFVQYACCAAWEALQMASAAGPLNKEAGLLAIGVGMGGLPNIEAGVEKQRNSGPKIISPYLIPSLIPNMAANFVAKTLNWPGRQMTISAACASGTIAIGEAANAIHSGDVLWALAGGTEAVITPITWSGFEAMHALTRLGIARPFDSSRDGMVPGEGAAVLLLESAEMAVARGAIILGFVNGFSVSTSTQAFVNPDTDCLSKVIDESLAGKIPSAVLAQASGLAKGDKEEMEALMRIPGKKDMRVTSIKGQLGHTFAASGPINVTAALTSFSMKRLPPIAGMENPDYSAGPLNYCRENGQWEPGPVLIPSYGFGGTHAALVISPATGK